MGEFEFPEPDFTVANATVPFYRSPLPLQTIASNQIAILLWRRRIRSINLDEGEIITQSWIEDQEFDVCDLLRVPATVRDTIEESLRLYRLRFLDWIEDHSYPVFVGSSDHDAIVKCIDYIDHSSDKIVARKLLDSDVLNWEEKYRLACRYCWKNDIERFWPSVSNNASITETTLYEGEVLYYWNCQMMGIFPEDLLGNENDSIELRMISFPELDDWLAVEYFWFKLNAGQRLQNLIDVLNRGYEKNMINLLPKLSAGELHRAMTSIPDSIFGTFCVQVACFDYVVRLWSYLQKVGTVEDLDNAFYTVWMMAFDAMKLAPEEGHQASVVLYELWNRLPNKFRRMLPSTNRAKNIFDRLNALKWVDIEEVYGRDMRFMLEVLKPVKIAKRNKIWRENWRKLIIRAEPVYLEKFLKLCFDNEDEMIRFKESAMMDFDELNLEFLAFINFRGYASKLMDYVNFCSSNERRVENLKRRILALQFCILKSDLEKFRHEDFDEFLFGTFSNVQFAQQFRAEYFLASENELLPVLLIDLDQGCLEYAMKICDYLSYELCPADVKREFLAHCRNYLIESDITEFQIGHWREFVTKCAGSEENLRAFKKSIPVDEVFHKIFSKIASRLPNLSHDQPGLCDNIVISNCILLDEFLLWYFDSVTAVKDYKTSQLKDGQSSRIIEVVDGAGRGAFVDYVLKWIFNGDIEQAERFKMNYF